MSDIINSLLVETHEMKKIVLLVIGVILLSGPAAAYQVTIDAPGTLSIGKPLIVTGVTTFGYGTPIDVVLYRQFSTEIGRKIVYIRQDRTFVAVFNTSGLAPGKYKVEVPASGIGNRAPAREVYLEDRASEIELASPDHQVYSGQIYIAGIARKAVNASIQVAAIRAGDTSVIGPVLAKTDAKGRFALGLPVPRPGYYEITFIDSEGFIGPYHIFSEIPGDPALNVSRNADGSGVIAALALASRDRQAIFEVETGECRSTIFASSDADLVLEYHDEYGNVHTVNGQGGRHTEWIQIEGGSPKVLIHVYPVLFFHEANVKIYGENILNITVLAGSGITTEKLGNSSGSVPAAAANGIIPAIALLGALIWHLRKQ
jgi:hypothetical protein